MHRCSEIGGMKGGKKSGTGAFDRNSHRSQGRRNGHQRPFFFRGFEVSNPYVQEVGRVAEVQDAAAANDIEMRH